MQGGHQPEHRFLFQQHHFEILYTYTTAHNATTRNHHMSRLFRVSLRLPSWALLAVHVRHAIQRLEILLTISGGQPIRWNVSKRLEIHGAKELSLAVVVIVVSLRSFALARSKNAESIECVNIIQPIA